MVCRTGKDFSGAWGAPAMYALEGGSIGFQIGGEATDFVFLVMNDRGVDSLLHSKVKLGVDVSAGAGPVGRSASADTDAYMRSEMLGYSRARGYLRASHLKARRYGPITKLTATSMVALSVPLRLSTDRKFKFRQVRRTSSRCCKRHPRS